MVSPHSSMFRPGQLVPLRLKDKEFTAIVINPNGLGSDRPTIDLGFRG